MKKKSRQKEIPPIPDDKIALTRENMRVVLERDKDKTKKGGKN